MGKVEIPDMPAEDARLLLDDIVRLSSATGIWSIDGV